MERRWNAALAEAQRLEREYAQAQQHQLAPLSDSDRALIRALMTDLPQIWCADTTTVAERKRLLRCLIRDVTLDSDSAPGMTVVRICWQTGATTTVQVRRPRSSDYLTTDAAILERMRALAPDHSDDEIAHVLNAEQCTTRWGKPWTYRRVHEVRVRNRIASACPIVPRAKEARGDGLVSVRTAAKWLQVTRGTIDVWVRRGILCGQHMAGRNPYWLRVSPGDIARLTAQTAAPGFQRLRQAAQTLGLTPAQIWEQVRTGQRAIRRMWRDQHWEWQVALSLGIDTDPLDHTPAVPLNSVTLHPTALEEQCE